MAAMLEMMKGDIEKNVYEAYKKAHDVQDKLNAVVTFVDPKEQLINYNQAGLMAGVPIVLKDNVCTKGIETTASSGILQGYVPIYNAHIVDKLKQAGAILIAKASMDELAMGGTNLTAYTGPVHNPYDTDRMAGGSSGGSAALVAAGVVPFAVGTDTGDSVRKPAAFCGIFGVKPTYGRISRYGIIPYSSSLDHVGFFTRSVRDAAVALEVLAGRDDRDMTSSFEPVPHYLDQVKGDLEGKKLAVLKNVTEVIENEAVSACFDHVVEEMKKRGAIVKEVVLNEDLMKAMLPTYYLIANCEATANHSNLDGIRFGLQNEGESCEDVMIASRTAGFGPLIKKRFVIGSYGLFVENQDKLFRKAQKVRRLIVEELKKAMEGMDGIIAPASGNVAPMLDDKSRDELSDGYLVAENHMVLGNFSGYPSATIPMGKVDGLPVGLNITCHPFEEGKMFDICRGIELITGLEDMCTEVK